MKWNRIGNEVSDLLMVSPMSPSVTVTVKEEEEETEKDDRSHRAADNSRCPSSIVLAIDGIGTVLSSIGATTTSGRSGSAVRIVPLAEWVPRIEGMRACDLAGTGSRVVTRCYKPLGEAI